MKRYLLILFTLLSLCGYSQRTNTFKDSSIFYKAVVFDSTIYITKGASNGKVLTSNGIGLATWQTINVGGRSVDTIYKNNTKDSIVFTISGIRYAVKDSFNLNTDSQTLSISNDTLTISGGNSVILPVYIQIDSSTINSYDVLNSQNTPPISPNTGDVYLVGNVPTGAWVGQAKDIAEWNGSGWDFTDGVQGDFLYNATTALTYIFRSGNWVQTTGIPALNNGNSISSGLRIGTNNARSLTFETNNTNRGRFDSIGRFHVYNLPISADTFVNVTDVNGKFGKIGKQSFLSGLSSTNIYNSDGLITDSFRNVYATSMLTFMDTANKTYSSIGGAVFPNPSTGALTYIPSLPGIYNSKYYWTPNASQFILASNKVDEDVTRFNVGSEIFDLNNNIIVGGKGSYEKSDSDYYYRLFYKHPDNESLWLTLGNKNPDRSGFFITPFEYSADVVGLKDTWKQPYTFRVADTLDNVFFGTKTEGKVFIDAPTNDFVTNVIGWNNGDSTLVITSIDSLVSQNAIPLSGTVSGSPVTGDIKIQSDINWKIYNNQASIDIPDDRSGITLTSKFADVGGNDVTFGLTEYAASIGSSFPFFQGFSGVQDFTANITELDYTQKIYVDQRISDTATQIRSEIADTASSLHTLIDTKVSATGTATLTNKRITARVDSTTSSATPTINTDNVDTYKLTAQALDITSFTTNLTGTPTDDQILHIVIIGTGARAITWGSKFESSTVTLPTTTVSTNRLDVYFIWNTAVSKWRCGGVW